MAPVSSHMKVSESFPSIEHLNDMATITSENERHRLNGKNYLTTCAAKNLFFFISRNPIRAADL